jgi:ferrous iron transport protein A
MGESMPASQAVRSAFSGELLWKESSMKTTLRDMKVGETGTVYGYVKGATLYRDKLLAMGLTRGTEFKVERMAPMGDPVEIVLRGFALTLRKDEAAALLVEKGGLS